MLRNTRPLLQFDYLEARIAPAVAREVGTLEIVDTDANPDYEWASPASGLAITGNVVGTHTLVGSLDVTYTRRF